MLREKCQKMAVVLVFLGLGLLFPANQAQAVPSFGRQTGMDCSACHTVFPELTPFGRTFKLTGYQISKKSDKPYEFPPPLSAMMKASFTNVSKSLPKNVLEFDNRANDNVNVPQEITVFYAGRILPYVGAFVEGAYDGISNKFLLDHTDFRIAYGEAKLFGKNLVFGLTVNNAPSVQDVLNTTPAFGFPWAGSDVALTPGAGTIFDALQEFQVAGAGAYFYWNNLLYGEFTAYRTARNGVTQFLGAGTLTETLVNGAIPYWRVFLQHQWQQHSLAVGTFGLYARIFPEDQTRGDTDSFLDVAVDAQYQFIGKKHIFTAQTSWIHEDQNRGASFALGNVGRRSSTLETYKINLNYYYRHRWGTFGGTAAYFTTWGSKDPVLFAPNPGGGSRTGKPNSDWFIIEGSYLPTKYTKLTVQYTIYNRFNGARTNYDGFGRNASDNNTLFLLLWLAI